MFKMIRNLGEESNTPILLNNQRKEGSLNVKIIFLAFVITTISAGLFILFCRRK
jgi:hypothetical protein